MKKAINFLLLVCLCVGIASATPSISLTPTNTTVIEKESDFTMSYNVTCDEDVNITVLVNGNQINGVSTTKAQSYVYADIGGANLYENQSNQYFTVRADNGTYMSNLTYYFTVDDQVPAVAWSVAPSTASIIGTSQQFNITSSDVLSSAGTLKYSIDGSTYTTGTSNSLFTPFSSSTTGNYTLSLWLNDSANNIKTDSRNYYVDATNPTVNAKSYVDNGDGTINLTYNVSDYNLDAVMYKIDSGSYSTLVNDLGTSNIAVTNNSLSVNAGVHTLTLYANDSVGNSITDTLSVSVSSTLNSTAYESSTVTGIDNITMDLQLDNGTDVSGVISSTNTLQALLSVNNTGVATSIQVEGINAALVNWGGAFTDITQEDSADTTSLESTFKGTVVDLLKVTGLSNWLPSGSYSYVTATFQNNMSDYHKLYYFSDTTALSYSDATALSSCGSTYNSSTSTLPCYVDGSSSLTVYLSSFSTVVALNDSIAPSVVVSTPSSSPESGFIPTITVSSDVYNCTMTENGSATIYSGTVNTAKTQCTFDRFDYTNGTSSYMNFTVYDTAGNLNNTENIAFTVNDLLAPTISAQDLSTVTSSSTTLTVNLTELGTLTYSINGGTNTTGWSTNAVTGSLSLSSLTNGTYQVYLYATDRYNHTSSATESFTVAIPGTTTTTTTTSSSSSSSGGGGGSGASWSGATSSTTATSVTAQNTITALIAGSNKVTLSNKDVPVKEINLVLTDTSNTATVKASKLSSKPSSAPDVTGKVVKEYLEINVLGMDKTKLEKAEIGFELPTTDGQDIVLLRLVDDVWTELPTRVDKTENGMNYFVAETPGFSYFAIASKEVVSEPTVPVETEEYLPDVPVEKVAEQTAETNSPPEYVEGSFETSDNNRIDSEPKNKMNIGQIIAIGAVLFGFGFVSYMVIKKE